MQALPSIAFLALLGSSALAQTGTLDQQAPYHPQPGANTNYNGSAGSLTWQQQVRAGLNGTLEGFVLQVTGVPGASFTATIRLGPAWNTGPSVFQATVTKTINSNWEDVFVDTTSAGIVVAPGTLFVIEIHGNDNGAGFNGSWIGAPTPPLYSEPLHLNGSCYADCQYRAGFQTWVLGTVAVGYCFGDMSGTACPCANFGATGNGCANSVTQAGAHLGASGAASVVADTFVLDGSGMPNSAVLYFQGTLKTAGGAGTVFGDGLRCASGTITRLGTETNVGGASSYPGAGDVPISIKGANSAGAVRVYQGWYRNAVAYCTPSTFNLTNGLEVTWAP